MLGLLIFGVIAACVALGIFMFKNGGLRLRDGSIIGRQQTQQEFDETVRRLEEKDIRREKWRKSL